MSVWQDAIGTIKQTFRIGFDRAVIDASSLSTERNFALPDKGGTVALLDDVEANPGIVLDAAEDLAAGNLVNIFNDSGTAKAQLADAGAEKQADGFVLAAVTNGDPATIFTTGLNDQVSGLTGGQNQYLSATVPGGLTATPPTGSGQLVQNVGKGVSSTSLNFQKGDVYKRA